MNDRSVGDSSASADGGPSPRLIERVRGPAVLYPNAYVWLVFVSAMDVMLTWKILELDGSEVNPIARRVIDAWALPGTIVFKFALMFFVILICEVVGREKDWLGKWLARMAVAVSATPVVYSLGLLSYHFAQVYGAGGRVTRGQGQGEWIGQVRRCALRSLVPAIRSASAIAPMPSPSKSAAEPV